MSKITDEIGAYGTIRDLGKAKVDKQPAIENLSSETASDIKAKVNEILEALRNSNVIEKS